MNKALNFIISLMMLLTSGLMMGQTVDFSVVSVGEESGLDFTRITQDGDGVCLPQVNTIYVARTIDGKGEIWRINIANGIEECILSHPQISFYSPSLSPDGQTLLLCGGNKIESGNIVYWNTDIFTCHKDGSDLRQLTYHAADDLSPAWGAKGDRIFFISQRGSADGVANVWMIPYLK